MPAFCAFYAMTPAEYRALSVEDFKAMGRFMTKALEGRK
jgi:hypothetical protein